MPPVTRPEFDLIYGVQEARICNIALGHIGAEVIKATDEDTKSARACRAVYAQTRDELLRTFPFNFATKITRIPLDEEYTRPMDEFTRAYKTEDWQDFSGTQEIDPAPLYDLEEIIVDTVADGGITMSQDLVGRQLTGAGIQSGTRITSVVPTDLDDLDAGGVLTLDRPTTSHQTAFTVSIPMLKLLEIAANDNNIYEVVGGGASRRILTNVGGDTLEMKYVEQVLDPDKFDSMFEHALALRIASKVAIDLTKNAMVVQMMQQEFSAIFQAAKISSNEEKQIDSPNPWWSDRQGIGSEPVQRR